MIFSVFSVLLITSVIMMNMDADSQSHVGQMVTTGLEYYIYAMWLLGVIWRLATYKRIWSDFKNRRLEQKKIKLVLNKYHKR